MTALDSAAATVATIASGLGAGVLTGTQLGGFPFLAALPRPDYLRAHAFFSTRYDPFMPACMITTTVLDTVRAIATRKPHQRALLISGAALAVSTSALSLAVNVPINKAVQQLDPEQPPADFDAEAVRSRWGTANAIRSGLAVAAFICTCLADAAGKPTPSEVSS